MDTWRARRWGNLKRGSLYCVDVPAIRDGMENRGRGQSCDMHWRQLNALDDQALTDIEVVYGDLLDANTKVREVTEGYELHLNQVAQAFQWGAEAWFYDRGEAQLLTKEDGRFIWAGIRDYDLVKGGSHHETASIIVQKKVLDKIEIVDQPM